MNYRIITTADMAFISQTDIICAYISLTEANIVQIVAYTTATKVDEFAAHLPHRFLQIYVIGLNGRAIGSTILVELARLTCNQPNIELHAICTYTSYAKDPNGNGLILCV